MSELSKPTLYNGYKLSNGLTVIQRIDKVFFTEIYQLSNNSYFYLFMHLKPSEIKSTKAEILKVEVNGKEYLGIINDKYSVEQVTAIIEGLTELRGFDAVAGMDDLKNLMYEDVIQPLRHPEKYEKFKLSVPNGILLYGPPGCGKTFIVRKLAEELGYSYFEIKHSDIASSYIHGTVGKVGKLFELAKIKSPSLVFIDEIEGLIPKRENVSSELMYKQEEVNEFLMQLNDAGKNKILVVAATNRPQLIDTALLRAGRMDKKLFVPPPDFNARRDLFQLFLSDRPVSDIDYDELAKKTENYVSSDIELIVTEAARSAVISESDSIDQKTVEESIKTTGPSINAEEIAHYMQFTSI